LRWFLKARHAVLLSSFESKHSFLELSADESFVGVLGILDIFVVECLIDTRMQGVDQDMTNAYVNIYEVNLLCPRITTRDILHSLQQNLWEIVYLMIRTKV
jgi:hypothetical protein